MTLSLDHHQRLHLTVLLGSLECRTISETRAAWHLMDRLALDDDEKQAIGLTVQSINGSEAYAWDLAKAIPERSYDLSDSESRQIQRALAACPRFIPSQSRRWLEPLLAQLPEALDGHNQMEDHHGTANAPRT